MLSRTLVRFAAFEHLHVYVDEEVQLDGPGRSACHMPLSHGLHEPMMLTEVYQTPQQLRKC